MLKTANTIRRTFAFTLKQDARLNAEQRQKLALTIGQTIESYVDETVARDQGDDTVQFSNLRTILQQSGVDHAEMVALEILQAGYTRGDKGYPPSKLHLWTDPFVEDRQRCCVIVPRIPTPLGLTNSMAGLGVTQRVMILPAAWDLSAQDFRKLRALANVHNFDDYTIRCLLDIKELDKSLGRLRDCCFNADQERRVSHGELYGMACSLGRWDRNGLAFQLKLVQELYAQDGLQPPGYRMLSHPYTFVSLDCRLSIPLSTAVSKLMVAHGNPSLNTTHNVYVSVLRSVHSRTLSTVLGRLPQQELEARQWLETVARSPLTSLLWSLRPEMLYVAYASGRDDLVLAAHHFALFREDVCKRFNTSSNDSSSGPFQWSAKTEVNYEYLGFPLCETPGDRMEWLLSEVRRAKWPLYMRDYVLSLIVRASGVPQKKFSRFGVAFPEIARGIWDEQGNLTIAAMEELVDVGGSDHLLQDSNSLHAQKWAMDIHADLFEDFVEQCAIYQTPMPLFREVVPYFITGKTRVNGSKISRMVVAVRTSRVVGEKVKTAEVYREDLPGVICLSDVCPAIDRRLTFVPHKEVVGWYQSAVETPGFQYLPGTLTPVPEAPDAEVATPIFKSEVRTAEQPLENAHTIFVAPFQGE